MPATPPLTLPPTTVHFIVRLDVPGKLLADVQADQQQFQETARQYAGFIDASVHTLDTRGGESVGIAAVYAFDTSENLVRWLESDDRRSLIRKFDQKYGKQTTISYPQSLAGFNAWVLPGQLPIPTDEHIPRWKMNLIVLAALYPLVLTLATWVPRWMPSASKPTIQLAVAAVAVTAMGFVLVPALGWLMNRWLKASRLVDHCIGLVVLLGAIYVCWHIAHWEIFS